MADGIVRKPPNEEFDPWQGIPQRYNLGVALTRGNVEAGRGARTCLNWSNSAGAQRAFSYAELDALTSRFASSLSRIGVSRGDRVLLRLPNLPEFYIAALAVAKLGGIFIPSSTQFRAGEIQYRLRDAEVAAVVTTTGLSQEVEAARSAVGHQVRMITVDYAQSDGPRGDHDFWRLIAVGDESFVPADTSSDEVAFLAYTSGTTGDPKGVVHLHRYPLAYDSLITLWHDYREDDVCACPAELGWLLPVASTFLYAMRSGIQIVLYHSLDGRFHSSQWFDLIRRYRITNLVATPTVYRMLIADPELERAELSSLRHGVSAGEPLPADTIAAVQGKLGFTPLDGIGMTECMVYCFNRRGAEVVPGSCGFPAPGCDIRLLDESLAEVASGSEGVLCIRRDSHPGMMRGYWNKPEQTAEIFRGPWYYSGDVLVQDAQGRYWFKGRNDDVIKASGYRISPFEVEGCLVEHPAVLEAAAVAGSDALRGCVVTAYIVLRSGSTETAALAAELQSWVKERLAPYKYPRRIVFVSELPKTPSGKIKRRELRQHEEEGR